MTDLDDVKAFLAVAEAGSFSGAAVEMATSKSVVSRRVARLEEGLGTRLFTRSSKGITPTEAGEALRSRAGSAFGELAEALRDAARSTGELTGVLRITAPIAFGTAHLAEFLVDFMRDHPKLKLDASFTNRRIDILADGFDVAVRMGALPDSTLIARRIAPMRISVAASPNYLAKVNAPKRPGDLTAHDCIIYGVPGGDLWRFRGKDRVTSIRVAGRMRSDNAETIVAAAIAGMGIVALPTFVLAGAIERGALIPLLTTFPMIEQALFAVRPPGPPPAKTRAFIDALAARFGPEPDWDYLSQASARARTNGSVG